MGLGPIVDDIFLFHRQNRRQKIDLRRAYGDGRITTSLESSDVVLGHVVPSGVREAICPVRSCGLGASNGTKGVLEYTVSRREKGNKRGTY